jgi:hypothetical protein
MNTEKPVKEEIFRDQAQMLHLTKPVQRNDTEILRPGIASGAQVVQDRIFLPTA